MLGARLATAATRGALAACASLLVMLPCAPAAMGATAQETATAAQLVKDATAVPVGWTGATNTCTAGTESAASIDATLRAMNAYRSVAGLTAVATDPALNQSALGTAMMQLAAYRAGRQPALSHNPPTDWPCYSAENATGSARSNLALGATGAGAITLYLADEGVDSLGHRRWILDPALQTIGTGSTDETNALTVLGAPRGTVPTGRQVPWPVAGAFAAAWVPTTWSISVGGTGDAVAFTSPQVTMTHNGAKVAVTQVSDLGTGYGTGRALSWRPTLNRTPLATGYHELRTVITGATVNGLPATIDYTTTIGVKLAPLAPTISYPKRKGLRVGTKLTAKFSRSTGRVVRGYRWLRNGKPIRRAKAVSYKLTALDRGKRIQVEVTSQGPDGTNRSVELSAAVKVRR